MILSAYDFFQKIDIYFDDWNMPLSTPMFHLFAFVHVRFFGQIPF